MIVENSIGQHKGWRVLKGVSRQQKEPKHMHIHPDDVAYTCSVLTNMHIEKKPLRTPCWKPMNKFPAAQ